MLSTARYCLAKELLRSPLEFSFRDPVIGDLFALFMRTGLWADLVAKMVAGRWYPPHDGGGQDE